MAFDPKPVSLEEYNQSLRDSVNAYYVHAMNDPSMSRSVLPRKWLKIISMPWMNFRLRRPKSGRKER